MIGRFLLFCLCIVSGSVSSSPLQNLEKTVLSGNCFGRIQSFMAYGKAFRLCENATTAENVFNAYQEGSVGLKHRLDASFEMMKAKAVTALGDSIVQVYDSDYVFTPLIDEQTVVVTRRLNWRFIENKHNRRQGYMVQYRIKPAEGVVLFKSATKIDD
ncbi:hypothetical protein ACI2KR_08350 [Pseudomonas luteola]